MVKILLETGVLTKQIFCGIETILMMIIISSMAIQILLAVVPQ